METWAANELQSIKGKVMLGTWLSCCWFYTIYVFSEMKGLHPSYTFIYTPLVRIIVLLVKKNVYPQNKTKIICIYNLVKFLKVLKTAFADTFRI